jgi:hypothetical protein
VLFDEFLDVALFNRDPVRFSRLEFALDISAASQIKLSFDTTLMKFLKDLVDTLLIEKFFLIVSTAEE